MKRAILIGIIMIIILSSYINTSKPTVSITNELRVLSDEEFNEFDTKWIEDKKASKETLRYYELKINGRNLDNITERNVNIPDIFQLTKEFKDLDMHGGMKSHEQDNKGENLFNYEYRIIINMREISVNELIEILEEYKIDIFIKDNKENIIEIDYNIGENLVILK